MINCFALASEEERLVEETGDAVHLDNSLNVLLLAQALYCQFELAVLVDLCLELFL